MKRKEAEQRAKEEAAGPNRRKRGQQWWEQELANSKGGAEVLEQLQGDPQVCVKQASSLLASACTKTSLIMFLHLLNHVRNGDLPTSSQ